MKKIQKYLWMLPALFVAYEFGNKLLEVLADSQEFADIISVVKPLAPISNILSYTVGVWDLIIALGLLIIPNLNFTKKYSKYIFLWVIVWPLIPASVRYFGGVADFEIVEVCEIIVVGVVAYLLYRKYN
jgi:hypothetical protein